jgi:hypothetical protein
MESIEGWLLSPHTVQDGCVRKVTGLLEQR